MRVDFKVFIDSKTTRVSDYLDALEGDEFDELVRQYIGKNQLIAILTEDEDVVDSIFNSIGGI